eukprot:TRINITY_DN2861_c1_g1_i2.p1 TRINITY_DN2861_c1_g1~~TRINITY_DN2861_c1_g1_i2.p1  ORF type:complete len:131 (+),score=22.70 TRINITY_DN2861_c1_g1_i2:352-744(+)
MTFPGVTISQMLWAVLVGDLLVALRHLNRPITVQHVIMFACALFSLLLLYLIGYDMLHMPFPLYYVLPISGADFIVLSRTTQSLCYAVMELSRQRTFVADNACRLLTRRYWCALLLYVLVAIPCQITADA